MILRKLAALEDNPSVYERNWKVHIGLVDVHPENINTPEAKEQAIATIGKAWDLVIPILKKHNVSAKVVLPTIVADEGWKDKIQSKKTIVLYYATLSDTPEKWQEMLNEIEQVLQENHMPAVNAIRGSQHINGSKYLFFSSSARGEDMERVDAKDRDALHLRASPFADIHIGARGITSP